MTPASSAGRGCCRGSSADSTWSKCLVYVDPVHHGQGIGTALLNELTREARGLGYRTIVASIAKDNRAGLALYSRQGFEIVGTIRNAAHKFDRWMDITLVQKELET